MLCCIRTPGDTEGGEGLDMVMPVTGLMMGMARVTEGWCSFSVDCWAWKAGGTKGGEVELSEKAGAWTGCEGECSSLGELLASEDRSDALCMDTS